MANEAQREPTMEEILASIRKIISDDDVGTHPPKAPLNAADFSAAPPPPVKLANLPAMNDDFEGGDTFADEDDVFDVAEALTEDAPGIDLDALPEPASFEQILSSAKAAVAATPTITTNYVPAAPTPPPAKIVAAPPEPRPVPKVETPMQNTTQRYQQTTLTDDNTAESAAGALGKLISRMDISSEKTIDGLVREMLKPMIKDWLDSNLPRIVEEKVEAEVQRIARMAR